MADVVAIENVRVHGPLKQFPFERLRDRRFPRARKPGQPNYRPAMPMLGRTRSRCNFPFAPEDVLTLDRGAIGVDTAVNDSAGYDDPIIDQYETAEIWDAIMIVQHHRRPRVDNHPTDFVSCQLLCTIARPLKRGGIHHFLN